MQLNNSGKTRGNLFINVLMGLAICLALYIVLTAGPAMAQGSLGVGRPEPAITPSGPFASILFWIQQQQKEFYRAMTEALKLIRSGNGGAWVLVGLSFGYGVLHAAGPGHGKAVISAYMLANEVQLRRGVMLSLASSFLQAIVAIVAIGLLVFVLRGLGIRQDGMTRWLEIASYSGIILLGLWLLWRKTFGRTKSANGHHHEHEHGHAKGAVASGQMLAFSTPDGHSHHHDHGHAHTQVHEHHHGHHHDHDHSGHGHVCSECGHAHMPDPEALKGDMGLREAVMAVFAVGLRPCTGALIVLTFAFLNGLYFAGIFSALAMALGTAITVSAIASAAVGGKHLVLRLTGATAASGNAIWWIEIAGAVFILFIGLTLLSASLY